MHMQREVMDVDVLIVGGGSAGLSCALRLMQNIQTHNAEVESGKKSGPLFHEPTIAVLEKGPQMGAHR